MNPVSALRRLRGKSMGYIVARSVTELRRVVGTPIQRRRLERLSTDEVLSAIGESSATALVRRWSAHGPFVAAREREQIAAFYTSNPALYAGLHARADAAFAREVDVLGSCITLGADIRWRRDYRSGHEWAKTPSDRLDYALLDQPCDVKIPWELSRFQHLFPLAQAWIVDRDVRGPAEFRAQVESWEADNPVGLGPNWACTMDVALRAWSLLWLMAAFADAPGLDEPFWRRLVRMLWQHGCWMPAHLEKGEVNGNHYISDALGLVACGAFFSTTDDGQRWLVLGGNILESEIALQLEPDGVDIEASVPYQRLVMEIFVAGRQLVESAGRPVSETYRSRLDAAAGYVAAYVTPAGLTPVVGDADDGRVMKFGGQDVRDHRYLVDIVAAMGGAFRRRDASANEEALWFLSEEERRRGNALPVRPVSPCAFFGTGGAAVLRSDAQYCFMDVGDVGLRGRGGHGHNDVLSFEWHAFGEPVLTDSGSYVYTASPAWRNRFRSTEFHTTLRVDGEELNRFYGPLSLWNLHDDARATGARVVSHTDRGCSVEAAHTGYARLADPVTVMRRIEMHYDRPVLEVTDRVDGAGAHLLEWFFQIAEGWTGAVHDGALVLSARTGTRVCIEGTGVAGTWSAKEGWFSPSYGIRRVRERWKFEARVVGPVEHAWLLAAQAATSS